MIYFKYFRHHQNNVLNVSLLSLLIISFFALIIEKIMFDEVLHEYYLEFPAPGEVHSAQADAAKRGMSSMLG
jgi:hypothetical protein